MASTFRKKQKARLIVAIVLCVLVVAAIATAVILKISQSRSLYSQFADKGFADALKTTYGYSSHYDLKQEDLDAVEGLVYFVQIGMDTSGGSYASYAYPVIMLCDNSYTDLLIKMSDPSYTSEEDQSDQSEHVKVCNYALSDPADLNKFRNLRVLRAMDTVELSEMAQNAYTTQIYAMYGLGDAIALDTVLNAVKLGSLTSLDQISSLTNLEQLSLCYSGITNLEGIEQFPKLTKLDVSNTALTSIAGLSKETELTTLSLNSVNVTATVQEDEADETESEPESSEPETSEAETSDTETSEDETSEEAEEPRKYNTTGIGNDMLKEIAALPKLRALSVTNNGISDLSALSGLTAMEYLYVGANPLTSLKGAENMTKLKAVYASECELTDLSALSNATELTFVNVEENKLVSLAGLEKATALEELHAESNQIEDASVLSGMTKIQQIHLGKNKLKKVPDLSKLTSLTSLELGSNEIEDASGLSELDPTEFETKEGETTTVTVDLSYNKIQSLSMKASAMTSLNVSNNELEGLKLSGCTGLQTLTASNNEKLTTISGLDTLTALTTLTAEQCGIEVLPSVKSLENLTTVTLNGSKLLNLSAFKDNGSITTLSMKDNGALVDISGLNTLTKLTTANFTNCTALQDEAIAAAFGTEGNLVFDESSSLTLTLTGCSGITDFSIFDSYGSMKVTHDEAA